MGTCHRDAIILSWIGPQEACLDCPRPHPKGRFWEDWVFWPRKITFLAIDFLSLGSSKNLWFAINLASNKTLIWKHPNWITYQSIKQTCPFQSPFALVYISIFHILPMAYRSLGTTWRWLLAQYHVAIIVSGVATDFICVIWGRGWPTSLV